MRERQRRRRPLPQQRWWWTRKLIGVCEGGEDVGAKQLSLSAVSLMLSQSISVHYLNELMKRKPERSSSDGEGNPDSNLMSNDEDGCMGMGLGSTSRVSLVPYFATKFSPSAIRDFNFLPERRRKDAVIQFSLSELISPTVTPCLFVFLSLTPLPRSFDI